MPAHPSLLARRIRHAALSLSLSGSLLALPSAWAEPLGYDIPAGSLATALSQFAAASGVTLSFSSEETAGLQSPGLHGDYELEQGFAQLLQGSDLLLRQAGEKRYVLLKAEQGNAMQLDATRISSSTLGQTTEGSGSYTTGAMQSATKLPLSIRETPQSVSVITRQRMDDQGMKTLEDVLKSTPRNLDDEERPAATQLLCAGLRGREPDDRRPLQRAVPLPHPRHELFAGHGDLRPS